MRSSKSQNVWAVIYLILAAVMYYMVNETISFGVGIMYKHIFAAVITILSFCIFLVATNLSRAWELVRYAGILILPHIVNLAFSIPLWISDLRTWDEVRRGLFSQLYHINIILAMAGMVYVLGKKGIWINLAAMLAANAVVFIETIQSYGLKAYLDELWTLIVTFADETGEIIMNMEVHELTFGLGVYIVFFIIDWKNLYKRPWVYVMIFLTVFFFLSGFKRIAIFAMCITMAAGFACRMIAGRKGKHTKVLVFAGFAAIAFMVLYVFLIDRGFMKYLEEEWGIRLMGRAHFLELVKDFYHFGPDYFGLGTGYIHELLQELIGTGLHNDILTLYLDIGFWGLIIWGLVAFPLRIWYVAKHQGSHGAILSFCYCLFVLGTAMTDNTLNYIYVTAAVAILTMSYGIEESTDELSRKKVWLQYDER